MKPSPNRNITAEEWAPWYPLILAMVDRWGATQTAHRLGATVQGVQVWVKQMSRPRARALAKIRAFEDDFPRYMWPTSVPYDPSTGRYKTGS